LRGSSCTRLWLEHGQSRRRGKCVGGLGQRSLFIALVIASGAGALLAEINEVIAGNVTVGPSYVHTGVGGDVDFYASGLAAGMERNGHGRIYGLHTPPSSVVQQPEDGKGLP